MSSAEEPVKERLSNTLGVRVPLWAEEYLSEVKKKNRWSTSDAVRFLLEEYIPVKKIIDENKSELKGLSINEHIDLEFQLLDVGALKVTITDGQDYTDILLNVDLAKRLAANIFTFIIDTHLNG